MLLKIARYGVMDPVGCARPVSIAAARSADGTCDAANPMFRFPPWKFTNCGGFWIELEESLVTFTYLCSVWFVNFLQGKAEASRN